MGEKYFKKTVVVLTVSPFPLTLANPQGNCGSL
jgi:hypothetical protein